MTRVVVVYLLVVLLLVIPVTPLRAQFFGGMPVVDFSHILQTVANGMTLGKQLDEAIRTYNTIVQKYQLAVLMSQQLKNLNAFNAQWLLWQVAAATDRYGRNGGWLANANGAPGGYIRSTIPRGPLDSIMGGLAPAAQLMAMSHYANGELADGVNAESLDVVGGIRARAGTAEAALRNLETVTFSPSQADNTEVAVLNKVNVASTLATRQAQDQTKLLAVMAEQMALQSKAQRDAQAVTLDVVIAQQTQGRAISAIEDNTAGLTSAIQSFHW